MGASSSRTIRSNDGERRVRFPKLFRIRFIPSLRRQRANHKWEASTFFEGSMKYDEVDTIGTACVFDNSFLSSNSDGSNNSDGNNSFRNETCRVRCCVDDYMDDLSFDHSSMAMVGSQQSTVAENNNFGTIYTIIEELVAEQEEDCKSNVRQSFSMNASTTSKNSEICSTATPFCIFKDDASILSSMLAPQQGTIVLSYNSTFHNRYDGQNSDYPLSSSMSGVNFLSSNSLNVGNRGEHANMTYYESDLWSVNWTEMNDDTDCSNYQGRMLKEMHTPKKEWVLEQEKPHEPIEFRLLAASSKESQRLECPSQTYKSPETTLTKETLYNLIEI